MEILKFIAWWWAKRGYHERFLILFFTWVSLIIPNIFLFGIKAFLIFFCGLALVAIGVGIYHTQKYFRGIWVEFSIERAAEAELVVRTLRGTQLDEEGWPVSREQLLEELKRKIRIKRINP